jgi:hypothetical protein
MVCVGALATISIDAATMAAKTGASARFLVERGWGVKLRDGVIESSCFLAG